MKESYAVLVHAVIAENMPQQATVISTTAQDEYRVVAECG